MKQGRKMSELNWKESEIKKADFIFEEFSEFTDGVRCLFLLQRHKEGGETNNSKLIKKITRNSQEFYQSLLELVRQKMNSDLPLRIYSSLNQRDFNKAIRQFKYEQLEADYYHEEQKENFYLDIKNRFIGCLMQPSQRAESFFLFDCDDKDGTDVQAEALQILPNELIVKMYKTKNGWHIITKPFNYTKLTFPENISFKKDGLLLLDY